MLLCDSRSGFGFQRYKGDWCGMLNFCGIMTVKILVYYTSHCELILFTLGGQILIMAALNIPLTWLAWLV